MSEPSPLTLSTPPAFQCYDCAGCGDCCRGKFAINISRADYDRLMAQGWEQEFPGVTLAEPKGDGFRLAHHADGTCLFLNEHGLCRIHAKFGEPAKPLACRLYPFRFVPLGGQVRVDIRYDCPQVAGNKGKPIPGYRTYLKGLLPQLVPANAAEMPVPPLFHGVPATWAQLCRITEAFERLLMTESLDVTRRILCCVNLAALLHSSHISALEGRALSEFLEAISGKLVETAADDLLPRQPPVGFVRLVFRQIMVIYTREDRVGQHSPLLQRLRVMLRTVRGRGAVPQMRPDFPDVRFDDLEQTFCEPTDEVAAVLVRYYRMRLASMGFFGMNFYGRSYLDGLNALWLTYPVIHWIARVYAVGKDLDAPDVDCITRAIQVMSHQHGATPVLDIPSERLRTRFLSERSNLRSLVIWYGT